MRKALMTAAFSLIISCGTPAGQSAASKPQVLDGTKLIGDIARAATDVAFPAALTAVLATSVATYMRVDLVGLKPGSVAIGGGTIAVTDLDIAVVKAQLAAVTASSPDLDLGTYWGLQGLTAESITPAALTAEWNQLTASVIPSTSPRLGLVGDSVVSFCRFLRDAAQAALCKNQEEKMRFAVNPATWDQIARHPHVLEAAMSAFGHIARKEPETADEILLGTALVDSAPAIAASLRRQQALAVKTPAPKKFGFGRGQQ